MLTICKEELRVATGGKGSSSLLPSTITFGHATI